VEISAKTELCGILLHPAGHTRSPAMHNAAFAAMEIDAVYLAFDVSPDQLAAGLDAARALGIRQLAISIPHKEAVLPLLDENDARALAIGAVNTVTRQGQRLLGANTDAIGVARALERETPLMGRRAVVLGGGGTARAAVYALREGGAHVTVLNRTVERAAAIAADLGAAEAGPLDALAQHAHDILVNTTSVGMGSDASPVPREHLRPGSVVLDAVYQPEQTRLLRDAASIGARTVGGKWMLVEQAVEQIRCWTGRTPDAGIMARAFDAAG
jgi:shikimate dehydrogenase